MKTGDMLKFLFIDSQEEDELSGYLDTIKEEMDLQKELEAKKTPLSQALKNAEVDMDGMELELDPEEGWCLSTDCANMFKKAVERLQSPEGMHAIASHDWAFHVNGDMSPTDPDTVYKIYFTAITGDDEPSDTEALVDLNKVAKDSFDFVNEPMPALKQKEKEEQFKQPQETPVGTAASGQRAKMAKKGKMA